MQHLLVPVNDQKGMVGMGTGPASMGKNCNGSYLPAPACMLPLLPMKKPLQR